MSHRFSILLALGLVLGLLPGATLPAAASETGTFDITLRGLKAGVLSYRGEERNGRYAASGAVRAAGIAAALVEAQVDTAAQGRVSGNSYRPERYTENGQQGGDRLVVRYDYRGGVPVITRDPPRAKPPKHAAPANRQAGTLDPMTTAYAMLRDRTRDKACKLDIDLYDGRRRSRIRYAKAAPRDGGGLTCHGEYRRVAGFSPEELAERPVWPFTVIYEPKGDLLRVTEVIVPTTYGNLRMRRR